MANVNKNPIALTKIRMAKGMTRAQLAEQTGIHVRAIEKWEQRFVSLLDVSAEKLLAVAKVLDCTVTDLIGESETEDYLKRIVVDKSTVNIGTLMLVSKVLNKNLDDVINEIVGEDKK